MMRIVLFVLLLVPCSLFAQEDSLAKDTSVVKVKTVEHLDDSNSKDKSNKVHTFVDQAAEFPGGYTAMSKFIAKNIRYPQAAIEMGIEGKVFTRFIVGKKGKIEEVKILRGMDNCDACNKEVIRVIKLMPRWKPGKNGGQKVRSYFDLPVNFNLN